MIERTAFLMKVLFSCFYDFSYRQLRTIFDILVRGKGETPIGEGVEIFWRRKLQESERRGAEDISLP